MCAINGFTWCDEALIREMNEKTKHRGPDDTGIFCNNHISLGHNRLSILDLSQAGHQPMHTPDNRYTITYNGEIYNYKELRKQLKNDGVTFSSHTDTEVILRLFEKEGTQAFSKLNGIFALAIWDNQEHTVTCARDRFGVKPLYYHHDNEKFIFSSEAKAILSFKHDTAIDNISLNNYFRFLYAVGPRTMWQHIKKLPPASYATFKHNTFTITQYAHTFPKLTTLNEEELHASIRATTRQAVRSQLISDRPVGIFLSGGLDSSVVAAIMAQEASGTINSFSVGFDTHINSEKFNADLELARKTAKHHGFKHHELYVSNKDVAENFERCVVAMDEPVSNHIQVATYLMAKEAKKHVAVVLGGDGGDEIFGGYDRYYYYRLLNRLRQHVPVLQQKKYAEMCGKLIKKPHLAEKLVAQPGVEQFLVMMQQKETHIASFLNPSYNNSSHVKECYQPFFGRTWDDYINMIMHVDLQSWLVDESLVRSDKLTMAHGLEQRVPLLDAQLVELAYSIPSRYKLHSATQGKKIFKDACAPLLSQDILNAKKRGFFSPTAKWLREDPLISLAREILSSNYTHHTKDMFNWNHITTILNDHITKKQYNLNTIWALMTFQVWARNNLT